MFSFCFVFLFFFFFRRTRFQSHRRQRLIGTECGVVRSINFPEEFFFEKNHRVVFGIDRLSHNVYVKKPVITELVRID